MLDKQVFDLTISDLNTYPVWYFPMDETVEDELTVRPVTDINDIGDSQVIVKTDFKDRNGKHYLGYIYWDKVKGVEVLKPIMFTSEDECVSFWNGIHTPTWDEYEESQQPIRHLFPIIFSSTAHSTLSSSSGTLTGLYYLDEHSLVQIIN